ncbi:MAG: hypothetical protein G3M70_13525 [Candidatus Nitronauta litoralis]|uniref:Uncharacterized protein n=1 Tax=Candidatus Nitronauta litoralis TaxID=2705533 RepID=A0A7T0BXU4_9BACT|nr:MAG: hypothetical protein G3M70_13525 [Candidatus Nitronauta litoralis]
MRLVEIKNVGTRPGEKDWTLFDEEFQNLSPLRPGGRWVGQPRLEVTMKGEQIELFPISDDCRYLVKTISHYEDYLTKNTEDWVTGIPYNHLRSFIPWPWERFNNAMEEAADRNLICECFDEVEAYPRDLDKIPS